MQKTRIPKRMFVWLMVHVARHGERSARRRLISLRATSAGEAEEKVLHLIAVTICGQAIETEEVEQIVASIAPFQRDVAGRLSERGS